MVSRAVSNIKKETVIKSFSCWGIMPHCKNYEFNNLHNQLKKALNLDEEKNIELTSINDSDTDFKMIANQEK